MTAATRWTIAIIAILGGAVASSVALALVAQMDGKSKTIPDYYQRATHFDIKIEEAKASRQLGWRTTVSLANGELHACMTDAQGAPIDATVDVIGQHRTTPDIDITTTLRPTIGGCYQVAFANKLGWYDIELRAKRGTQTFVTSAVVDQQ